MWKPLVYTTILVVAVTTAAHDANLVKNPAFEDGAAADGVPEDWELYGALGPHRCISIVESDGRKALLIVDNDPHEEVGVTQRIPAEPGKSYVTRVAIKGVRDASASGSYVQMRFMPANEFEQRGLSPDPTDAFSDVVVAGMAPPGTEYIQLYLYTHRTVTPKVLVGNVSLEQMDELPRELMLTNPAPLPITELKDLCIQTDLTSARIVAPAHCDELVSLINDSAQTPYPYLEDAPGMLPPSSTLILLGNRSTNSVVSELYDRFYTLLDLQYPGPGGHVVRTLHNPYGNGHNIILVGGSDHAGISKATDVFLERLRANNGPAIGHLMEIELGDGIEVPTDLRDFEIWNASKGYGSIGYFGWNSISKRMAMYYMTGEPFHAREALRLAFPDDQAKVEIADIDGERIENKDDPLGGPYHYNAHMMILFWDLIEESPVFTDKERMKVTQAFMRQLEHHGIRSAYVGPNTGVPGAVGSRHGQWTAISLYCVGRYFAKYYPDPLWDICEHNGAQHFASLHKHAWVSGENDNLFWYSTAIAPIFTYMLLTGDRKPLENGVVATLLRGQEILASGRAPDAALNSASIGFLRKAAYVTGDSRWLEYLDRTGQDLHVFRLGQSFSPDDGVEPTPPTDLIGHWEVNPMPEPMWRWRNNGLPLEESYLFASCRSAADATGDFLQLDGFNGASRNPYHTFTILQMRIDGVTIAESYLNQLRTRVDGMVEPEVAMDAALRHHAIVGQTITAIGEVPDAAFANWRRTIVQRMGRYALVVDDVTPRIDSQNLEAEFSWQTKLGDWQAVAERPSTMTLDAPDSRKAAVSMSAPAKVRAGAPSSTMTWVGPAQAGVPRHFFSVLGFDAQSGCLDAAAVGDNAAALLLPESALAVRGRYEGISGELVVLSEDHLYGRGATSVRDLLTADRPVEVDWDFPTNKLCVVAAEQTQLSLAGGKTHSIGPGQHEVDVAPLVEVLQKTQEWLATQLSNARNQREQLTAAEAPPAPTAPPLAEGTSSELGGPIIDLVAAPYESGRILFAAVGQTIHAIAEDGSVLRTLECDGPIRMLRWWNEHRLLLVGCTDEQVIAFDEAGARKWVFVSKMDSAVFRAAKTYWFKSAPGHEGIHGLHTGVFLDGKTQAFVGSACTLEILDENGQLLHRMPQFWGKVSVMRIIPERNNALNLLAARRYNGTNTLGIISNQTLDPSPRGYISVPSGHTYMPGWSAMNRHHIFFEDFDGDGAKEVMTEINGRWNRVSVWSASGAAKYSVSFGPGPSIFAKTMRDIDTADLDDDGAHEIVTAIADGMLVMLTGKCEKLWALRLDSPATVLACVGDRIVIGCENGAVELRDPTGQLLRHGTVNGRPTQILTEEATSVTIATETGELKTFIL